MPLSQLSDLKTDIHRDFQQILCLHLRHYRTLTQVIDLSTDLSRYGNNQENRQDLLSSISRFQGQLASEVTTTYALTKALTDYITTLQNAPHFRPEIIGVLAVLRRSLDERAGHLARLVFALNPVYFTLGFSSTEFDHAKEYFSQLAASNSEDTERLYDSLLILNDLFDLSSPLGLN